MKIKLKYNDFVRLLRVENTESWALNLSVRADGVYVKPIDADAAIIPEERAALTEHPTGNLAEPALRFPCTLPELRAFVERYGLLPSVDAFLLAEMVEAACLGDPSGIGGTTKPHVSRKLATLMQAARTKWANADRDDRTTHPINDEVAKWLEDHGYSSALARKGATIIRPDWAGTGRKPEE